jgi:hypothetical protein
MPALTAAAARKLDRREPLAVDAARPFAIKRSVHELEIGAGAADFAAALREVLRDPGARFGLIDVKRAAERESSDFAVGERFHGCVRLERVAARLGPRHPALARLLSALGRSRLGAWLEDNAMSDYAEVVSARLEPDLAAGEPFEVVYRYLRGTPLAGQSTFLVEPLTPTRCRFRVIFEFQEVGGLAITVLHRFGLQMHDQVTAIQARLAAARIGAEILSNTIRESGQVNRAVTAPAPPGPPRSRPGRWRALR